MKVWILTTEYNEYDQYGEYFVTWFKDKPSIETLGKLLGEDIAKHVLTNKSNTAPKYVSSFGGRQDTEDQWYYLRQVEEGQDSHQEY